MTNELVVSAARLHCHPTDLESAAIPRMQISITTVPNVRFKLSTDDVQTVV